MHESIALRATIEALLAEFAYLLDHGLADRAVALFTDDAVFASPAVTLRGAAEIVAGFQARARQTHVTRHLHSNLHLVVESSERAAATVVLTLYRSDAGLGAPRPFLIADCHDVYVLGADGRWRFAERAIVPVFVTQPRPAPQGER
ncbi:MAG: nuclear transport factor 2 family protein [bacterium]